MYLSTYFFFTTENFEKKKTVYGRIKNALIRERPLYVYLLNGGGWIFIVVSFLGCIFFFDETLLPF